MFLQEQIDKIDSYPDKSLFFQNPQIIEGWWKLVRATEKIIAPYDPEYIKKWLQRTDTYVSYLLAMRGLNLIYRKLQWDYLDQLKKLTDFYDGWEKKECISDDLIEMLSEEYFLGVLKKDITKDYADTNSKLLKARSDEFSVLLEISNYLLAMMDHVNLVFMGNNPSIEEFAKAIDNDLKEWTRNFGNKMFGNMKEELNRHYKTHRTDNNTPSLWSEMLDADEKALNLAKRQELYNCDDEKQEHWGEDMKKKMDENGKLMQQIYSSCRTDELLNLGKAENVQPFIALLTRDNLYMFYEIIVRRTLIQCEMFPELKAQHNTWLYRTIEHRSDDEEEIDIDNANEIPQELMTDDANVLWERLRNKGFIKTNSYALAEGISANQATYIADCMAEKLKIQKKWKVFQQLWGIQNMAQMAGAWKQTGKEPPRSGEIRKLTE